MLSIKNSVTSPKKEVKTQVHISKILKIKYPHV